MERVVPCDLEEWSTVLESHSVRYPGRTVESLRRKYMTLHRKKAPTGDPDVPEHIALAKTVFEAIGDKASIGRGDDIFDMEGDGAFVAADGTRSTVPAPVNYAHANTQQSDTGSTATDVSPERVGGRRGGRNGKSDFMSIFLAQMQAESQARADERAERAEERREFQRMMIMMAGKTAGQKRKRKYRAHKKKRASIQSSSSNSSSSSSSGSSSSSSSDESSANEKKFSL